MPQVVKANAARQGTWPKLHFAIRAAPLGWVGGQLAVRVSMRLAAPADMLPAINEPRPNQSPSQNDFELGARMLAHLAIEVREDELGCRLLSSSAQHGNDAFSHRNHVRVPALRGLAVVGASHENGAAV